MRRILQTVLVIGLWMLTSASLAHAHGGMAGPDEMGPPMAISGALAFSGYWLMIFWPSLRRQRGRKDKD